MAAAIASIVAGTLLRWIAVPPIVGDVDGVNFARALHVYDPLHQSPHFPGYPVYVFLARVASAFGVRETLALALPAIVLFPPAAWILFSGARRHLGSHPALGAVATASLAPLSVLAGGWPASDGTGIVFLAAALGLLGLALPRHRSVSAEPPPVRPGPFAPNSRALRLAIAGLLFGLLLGVRLSWWPIVVSASLLAAGSNRRALGPLTAGFIAGAAAWFLPLGLAIGPRVLADGYVAFGLGHMTRFGGTALSDPAPFAARLSDALATLLYSGLGMGRPLLSAPISVASGLVGFLTLVGAGIALADGIASIPVRTRFASLSPPRVPIAFAEGTLDRAPEGLSRAVGIALVLAIPYAAWVLLAQNVEKARHMIPLVLVAGTISAAGLSRIGRRPLAVGALAALWATLAFRAAFLQGTTAPPAAALVAGVVEAHAPERLQVFAGEESRLFEHLAPMYRVWRAADGGILDREARNAHARGAEVWITSRAPGIDRLEPLLQPIARYEMERSVRGPDASIAIYRFDPARVGSAGENGKDE